MNDQYADHPQSAALEMLFNNALRLRRQRASEQRGFADLTTMAVSVDGEHVAPSASEGGHARIAVEKHARLVEVFSGGNKPLLLASLLFSAEAFQLSPYARLLGSSTYSVSLEDRIRVKFTVQHSSGNESEYSIHIRIIDFRVPWHERLWGRIQTLTSGLSVPQLVGATLVVVAGISLGVVLLVRGIVDHQALVTKTTADSDPRIAKTTPSPGAAELSPSPALEKKADNNSRSNLTAKNQIPTKPTISRPPSKTSETTDAVIEDRSGESFPPISFGDDVRSATSSSGSDLGPLKLPRGRYHMAIILPDESAKGVYTVDIEDPFRKSVFRTPATSYDGKSIVVVMDLRYLSDMEYRVCLTNEDHVPVCREIVVDDTERQQDK